MIERTASGRVVLTLEGDTWGRSEVFPSEGHLLVSLSHRSRSVLDDLVRDLRSHVSAAEWVEALCGEISRADPAISMEPRAWAARSTDAALLGAALWDTLRAAQAAVDRFDAPAADVAGGTP